MSTEEIALKARTIALQRRIPFKEAYRQVTEQAEHYGRLRQDVLRYVKERYPDFYARKYKPQAGQGSLFGGEEEQARAPVGGTTVAGKDYPGGEWVPEEAVAEAAAETGKSEQEVAQDIQEGVDPVKEPVKPAFAAAEPKLEPLKVGTRVQMQDVLFKPGFPNDPRHGQTGTIVGPAKNQVTGTEYRVRFDDGKEEDFGKDELKPVDVAKLLEKLHSPESIVESLNKARRETDAREKAYHDALDKLPEGTSSSRGRTSLRKSLFLAVRAEPTIRFGST